MILYLTNDLRSCREGGIIENTSFKHAIKNIANAFYEGKHVLRGDLEILQDCLNMFLYDDEIAPIFNSLVQNYATMTIPSDITYYIEIVKENPAERIEGHCVVAQRCISDFENTDACLASQLACEDLNDCVFYRFVLDWYVQENNLKYNVNLNDLHGGGGRTIDNVTKHWIEMKQEVLCIVDTDRKYPNMPLDKNKCPYKCKKFDKNRAGYRCIDIDVQEIENLVPLNYIDNLTYKYPLNIKYKRHFDYLRNNNDTEELLRFFDCKNGILQSDSLRKDKNYHAFAEKCWKLNPEICKTESFDDYLDGLQKEDNVYERLNSCLMRDILSYVKDAKKESNLPAPNLLNFQLNEWNRIGKEMVNWGCARIPEGIS